jgi:hypothetical protein
MIITTNPEGQSQFTGQSGLNGVDVYGCQQMTNVVAQ